jgi:pimeloyl-ACP methyl ester carboxylesterase
VAYRESGSKEGPCVLLIHGFGVSGFQYRDIELPNHRVFSIDLVGFGLSSKPSEVDFSMEFWRDQIANFVSEVVKEPVALVGNSIGSLAAVHVASETPELVKGICLINCAGGMNNKVKQMPGDFDGFGWQYKLVGPIFKVVLAIIDTILKIEPVATKIFDNVRSEESVRNALAGVYKNPARVDDALVKSICQAAENEGALPVFVNILTGNPGPRPEELMDAVTCPIFIIWGSEDRITPLDFPLGQYFQNLPQTRTGQRKTSFIELKGQGHCVQDDAPEEVNQLLLKWFREDELFSSASSA